MPNRTSYTVVIVGPLPPDLSRRLAELQAQGIKAKKPA